MSLAARQALLARFVDDVAVEAEVRRDPSGAAAAHGVPLDFAQWLASIDARRLTSFRRSRVHKDQVRDGRPPTRIDGEPPRTACSSTDARDE